MTPPAAKRQSGEAGAQEAPARRRGRPRSEKAHEAILLATLQLLADEGLERMTMDAVAERAGVSKATIYRRWPSKNELAVDAVARLPPSEPLADHGSLATDLTALGTSQAVRLERTNIPGIVPRVLAESMGDPELHALLMERGVQPIRALLASLVERAIERGELAADTDVELLVDIIHGTGVYRMLINRGDPTAIVSHVPRLMKLLTGQ